MADRDLHSNISVATALNTTAISAGGTTTGAIIDTLGFRSVEFVLQSGALTSGASFAPALTDGSAANLAGGAAVAAADLLGTVAGATFTKADDNKTKRIGYRGHKRYVRCDIVAVNEVKASGTVAMSGFVEDDTITVGATTFTGKASPSGVVQFAIGASDAETLANAAAKVNAHSVAGPLVTMSALGAVEAKAAGTAGNSIALAISAHGSVSAAFLAGGVDAVGTMSAVCVLGHPWTGPVA